MLDPAQAYIAATRGHYEGAVRWGHVEISGDWIAGLEPALHLQKETAAEIAGDHETWRNRRTGELITLVFSKGRHRITKTWINGEIASPFIAVDLLERPSSDDARVLPGSGGTLRYTSADEFSRAPRGDWWPDDEADFVELLTDAFDEYDDVRILARVDSTCPDVDVRCAVVCIRDAPWAHEAGTHAWALIVQGYSELTVIEYPDAAAAEIAFHAHVAAREQLGRMYDYVKVPGQGRTALPPQR
ncbi:hypothetical protein [Saccharopolyspora elongata]|uniref:Uncharacterized protein n=1 Tax=Saccharopolyspora elongata TaxID=2530387 RepID=A0A4R4XVK2_9PSEU|nr:hypothetical protein [Saccharopolyspora elongata]TDD35496.1 hypothetical protein E1288_43125 [Saccharopolyspora elongata]